VIRNFIMRADHQLLVMTSPLSYLFKSIICMSLIDFNVGVHILFVSWVEECGGIHLTSWACPMISWACLMTRAIYFTDKSPTLCSSCIKTFSVYWQTDIHSVWILHMARVLSMIGCCLQSNLIISMYNVSLWCIMMSLNTCSMHDYEI
jgi:hypothetical protein